MIFFLYGQDSYRSHKKLLQLKGQFFGKYPEADIYTFDFSQEDNGVGSFIAHFSTDGLFSSKKMIIGKRPFSLSAENTQEMVYALEKHRTFLENDKDTILVLWDDAIDKRKKLFKLLNASQHKEVFNVLTGQELSWYIQQICGKYGKKMQPKVLQVFVERVESDSARIEQEILKISHFVQEREEVTVEDVDTLVVDDGRDVAFALVDAMAIRDKKKALSLLRKQFAQGDDPIKLLGLFVYHFRQLLLVSEQVSQGVLDYGMIARNLKIHPFVAKKLLAESHLVSLEKTKRVFKLLSRYDIAIKTGRIDSELALERFVLSL